jgi:hypothetical protein
MAKRSRTARQKPSRPENGEQRGSPASPPEKSARRSETNPEPEARPPIMSAGCLIATIVLTFLVTRIPLEAATNTLDSSWGAVLSYAHAKHWQFGTDIVFTYGPLGFLDQGWFTGRHEGLRMFLAFLRGGGIACGVCLLAWRMSLIWRCLFLGIIVLLPASAHPNEIEPLMEVGLLCWGMLNLLESGSHNRIFAAGLVAMATVGSLGKFTFFLMSAMTVAAAAFDLAMRQRFRLALGLTGGYGLSFLAGWMLLRQNVFNIGVYLANALHVSTGYEQTMGWQTAQDAWTAGVILAVLALVTALIYSAAADFNPGRWSGLRRCLLFAWAGCVVYLSWKHGFIRFKADLFATTVPALVLAMDAVQCESKAARLRARGFAAGSCLVAIALMWFLTPHYFGEFASGDIQLLSGNVGALLEPSARLDRMTRALNKERDQAQLPKIRALIGAATADVFGQYQSYAIFNDLNYRPRPMFQSYSAYNKPLMRLNENLYDSDRAPEFVLFNLEPIDGRFPPLEDAYVLRNLLFNYAPVDSEGKFLLLKRRRSIQPGMSLLREGSARLGQQISMTEFGDANLWMEVFVQPTWRGRLRQLLYQPAEVYLGVQAKLFRAPAPMLAAGFLASPLMFHNADVTNWYSGQAPQRPGTYLVGVDENDQKFWQNEFKYRIYQIEAKPGLNASAGIGRLNQTAAR